MVVIPIFVWFLFEWNHITIASIIWVCSCITTNDIFWMVYKSWYAFSVALCLFFSCWKYGWFLVTNKNERTMFFISCAFLLLSWWYVAKYITSEEIISTSSGWRNWELRDCTTFSPELKIVFQFLVLMGGVGWGGEEEGRGCVSLLIWMLICFLIFRKSQEKISSWNGWNSRRCCSSWY